MQRSGSLSLSLSLSLPLSLSLSSSSLLEVTLHFQHVTPKKASPFVWKFEVEHSTLQFQEREIREYLRQHADLLSLLGAEAPSRTPAPRVDQPQAPLHRPHATHAPHPTPQAPITPLSSSRQPTTTSPTRAPVTSHPQAQHTRRTTVPPTQSKLTTLPSTVPATSTSAKLSPVRSQASRAHGALLAARFFPSPKELAEATTAVSSNLRPTSWDHSCLSVQSPLSRLAAWWR